MSDGGGNDKQRRFKQTYIDSFPGKLGTPMLGVGGEREEGRRVGGGRREGGGEERSTGVAEAGREEEDLKEEFLGHKESVLSLKVLNYSNLNINTLDMRLTALKTACSVFEGHKKCGCGLSVSNLVLYILSEFGLCSPAVWISGTCLRSVLIRVEARLHSHVL